MSRITSTVLFLGVAVLLVTWIVSPASSAPQDASAPPAAAAPAPPVAAPVEPIRLPDIETPAPEYRVPVRDPFAFSSRERPRRDSVEIDARLAPPPPPLPSLVAILTDMKPGGAMHRAALSDASGAVRIVGAGDAYGPFTVSDIRGSTVALVDAASGLTHQLSLR